ncbi:MAG: gamma-glutamyl-gamma-aminobutyrate hydrolase family protein [Deltaproteobacteria bacterium]|nr:gamma-glutamyl-gamma-aminobutyrate hydrolase family protein [Deltaproteobacteria bacterium]
MDDTRGLRKVLVVQHVAAEPLGTLDPLLRRRRIRVRYHNARRAPEERPDLGDVDALIVLGGPQNLDEQDKYPHLKAELQLVEAALQRGVPVLGICLGAQLLAHALGASVGRNRAPELGWSPLHLTAAGQQDPVLSAVDDGAPMFHWHGDTFAIPSGCERLAYTVGCDNQAFRAGERNWGFQFHLEVDASLVERWLGVYAEQLAHSPACGGVADIRAHTQAHIAGLQQTADLVFGRLFDVWGWQPRQVPLVLGHRMTGPVEGG